MEQPTPAPNVARNIWVALIASVPVLYAVSRLVSFPPAAASPMIFPLLVVVAIGDAAASLFYPWFLHRQAAKQLRLETREIPGVIGPDSPNAAQQVFVDPEKARAAAQRVYHSPFILSLALAESIALFGLVLRSRGLPDEQVLPFFGAALVLMALRYPGPRAAEKALERALGARFP